MRILLIVIGMLLTLSTGASADQNATVAIKKAHKVVVKSGMSQKQVMGMIHCLNTLKKHDSVEDATKVAIEKIKGHCAMLGLDDKKCMKKQRKVAHYIYNCFAKAEFLRDYVNKSTPQ